MSRRTGKLLFGVLALPFAAFLLPLATPARWDGEKDLLVRFVVIDAKTREPIPAAVVHIEDGFRTASYCRESGEQEFDLETDSAGVAQRLVKRCATYGRDWRTGGGRGFSLAQTWNSYAPDWTVSVSAAGYGPSRPLRLLDYRHQAIRADAASELEVRIEMFPN